MGPARGVMVTFGPVPSRRLGRSLGVSNLGAGKSCSYSCVYCQLGGTKGRQLRRRLFEAPESVYDAVAERVAACRASGQGIDHITFVPEGEPTLDVNLGETIRGVRRLGIPVAVITNGSLLWRPDVRADLALKLRASRAAHRIPAPVAPHGESVADGLPVTPA